MKMRNGKDTQIHESMSLWINAIYEAAEVQIASGGGTIYVVDGEHWYLWYAGWLWNLQDECEVGDLFDNYGFYKRPGWVSKSRLIQTFCKNLVRRLPMPTHCLSQPITRQTDCTLAQYREDLQQYILNTYYPTN